MNRFFSFNIVLQGFGKRDKLIQLNKDVFCKTLQIIIGGN